MWRWTGATPGSRGRDGSCACAEPYASGPGDPSASNDQPTSCAALCQGKAQWVKPRSDKLGQDGDGARGQGGEERQVSEPRFGVKGRTQTLHSGARQRPEREDSLASPRTRCCADGQVARCHQRLEGEVQPEEEAESRAGRGASSAGSPSRSRRPRRLPQARRGPSPDRRRCTASTAGPRPGPAHRAERMPTRAPSVPMVRVARSSRSPSIMWSALREPNGRSRGVYEGPAPASITLDGR